MTPTRKRTPILMRVMEQGVWVHAVKLSWRYSEEDTWRTDHAACEAADGTVQPKPFAAGDGMGCDWGGPRPPEHGRQLTGVLHVCGGWARMGLPGPPTRGPAGRTGSTSRSASQAAD